MENLIVIIYNYKVYGVGAIIAAVATYFTPDHIDKIIEMLLAALGITRLTLTKE